MIWAAETYGETLNVGKMEVDANPGPVPGWPVGGAS